MGEVHTWKLTSVYPTEAILEGCEIYLHLIFLTLCVLKFFVYIFKSWTDFCKVESDENKLGNYAQCSLSGATSPLVLTGGGVKS